MAQQNRKRGMNFVKAGGGGTYNPTKSSKPIGISLKPMKPSIFEQPKPTTSRLKKSDADRFAHFPFSDCSSDFLPVLFLFICCTNLNSNLFILLCFVSWFNDDDDDEPARKEVVQSIRKTVQEENEEVDPLEAFMAQNAQVVEKEKKTMGIEKEKAVFLDEMEPDVVDTYIAKKAQEQEQAAYDEDGILKDEGIFYRYALV